MSQYLNIYIKVKGQDKPLHLADYCRSSEVYQSICEQCAVPYDMDGETYGDLKAKDILACIAELDKSNEALVNACQLRMEALEHNKDKDVAESILACIDDYKKGIEENNVIHQEISHILWLAERAEESKGFEWGDVEGIKVNIS